MDDWDPIARYQYKANTVFAHAPTEFKLSPCKLTWEEPCWVHADISLVPQTPATREEFFASLLLPNRWDAFAKVSWENQLGDAFSPYLSQIKGPHADDWIHALLDCHQELKKQLHDTLSLFLEPFHFVARKEFVTVNLPTVLKENPEDMSVYLAFEKGSYSHYYYLRIHSKPPFIGPHPKCLWFQIRLPASLHPEDGIPWFVATIRRLPKKHQPAEVEAWTNRLLHFEPQLALPVDGAEKPWAEKPKIVLVLGPTAKVGYRILYHFERRDISHVVRQKDIVTIEGTERHQWADKEMEFVRTFFLLAFDEAAAERVERQILDGKRIHFGLDGDVLGIICRSGHVIHAINASIQIVRQLCVEQGLDLRQICNPRFKLKSYELCKPGEPF